MEQLQPKTGFKTSEFAITAATTISGFAVLLGYLPVDKADAFTQAVVSVVGGLIVIISTVTYVLGRIKVKQDALPIIASKTPALATPTVDKVTNLSAEPTAYPK